MTKEPTVTLELTRAELRALWIWLQQCYPNRENFGSALEKIGDALEAAGIETDIETMPAEAFADLDGD